MLAKYMYEHRKIWSFFLSSQTIKSINLRNTPNEQLPYLSLMIDLLDFEAEQNYDFVFDDPVSYCWYIQFA